MSQLESLTKSLALKLIFIIIIFLVFSTSGCIHIDLGDPFKDPEDKPLEFNVVTKQGFPINHTFDTLDDQRLEKSRTQPFIVFKHTKWVNVSISVVLNDFGFLNSSITNSTIIDRYVHISLKNPEGIYFDHNFKESEKRLVPLIPLTFGKWIVSVEAKGFGYGGTYDSFMVNVKANEPI